MSVDGVESQSQARLLAQKRQAVQDEQNALEIDKAKAGRLRTKSAEAEKEKTDKEIIEISKNAEKQVENAKKMNAERVRNLNDNSEKNYTKMAQDTADHIRSLNENAMKLIDDHRASSMERIKYADDLSQDPFYHMKTLSPVLTEAEKDYTIKFPVAPAEAPNVFVAGDGSSVKVSLARRYRDRVADTASDHVTQTSSYQSIVEQINMPGAYDSKGIKKEYKDGIMTITVPKLMPKPIVATNKE